MNNIILCWPTAVVLLSFVDCASFCKNLNKINDKKLLFLQLIFYLKFGNSYLFNYAIFIKLNLVTLFCFMFSQVIEHEQYINKQLINI